MECGQLAYLVLSASFILLTLIWPRPYRHTRHHGPYPTGTWWWHWSCTWLGIKSSSVWILSVQSSWPVTTMRTSICLTPTTVTAPTTSGDTRDIATMPQVQRKEQSNSQGKVNSVIHQTLSILYPLVARSIGSLGWCTGVIGMPETESVKN